MKNTSKGIIQTKLELDRLEEAKAVLFADDDEEIILPKKMLPPEVREGDTLIMTMATDEAEKIRHQQKAKDLLNEILK